VAFDNRDWPRFILAGIITAAICGILLQASYSHLAL
jgi:hypothetical protein